MINFDDVTKKYNPNGPQIRDDLCRILIIRGSGSGKSNSLFNVVNKESDIDKIYLYAKEPYKAKYRFLIDKRQSTGLKHFNDSKAFIFNKE